MNLRILCWNVAKSYNRIKIALEMEDRYDIIAIQEPGRSTATGGIRNTRASRYWALDSANQGRAALYMSKRFAINRWDYEQGEDGNGEARRRREGNKEMVGLLTNLGLGS